MALFNSIINEVREKLGIGAQAEDLLKVLLEMLSDRENGGFRGFLGRFEEAGLGDLASSWVNSGANMPISYEQTESVFGEGTLREVAAEVGLEYRTATEATALMTPHIVDELTPTGEIPEDADLLATLGGFLPSTGKPVAASPPADREEAGSFLKLILPVLIVAILVGIGYLVFAGPSVPVRQTTAPAPVNANHSAGHNANRAPTDENVTSAFTLKAAAGKYTVSGVVADEALRTQIVDALTAQFGADNVDFSGLTVAAGAGSFGPDWWAGFSRLLPNLKEWPAGEIGFTGSALTTVDNLPAAALGQIKTLFGAGWELPVSIIGAEAAAERANEDALKGLSEAESADQIVEALNISIINFASGSTAIPADARQVLEKAAEALKQQPAGTTIEIGGYTDSDGADAANLALSEARATAVKNELVKLGVAAEMLTAKGYGEANPVAPNDTPDNKFKNRRIEYRRF